MAVALIPYTLHDTVLEPAWRGSGVRYVWALPANVTAAIDLRPVASVTDLTAVGYALGLVDGDLPDGAVSLQTGNVSRDKSTWRRLLGFTPDGDTPRAWLRSHLLAGADEAGEAACRPIRGSRAVDIWLGDCDRHELDQTERLQQAVYARRDLDRIFDAVERGELPAHHHRKVLAAYAADLGISPLALRSKAARWRSESPLTPETSISEPFKPDGVVQLNGYNGWVATADRFTTGNGLLYISGAGNDETYWARHPTSLSSANNEATLSDLTGGTFHPAGVLCRGDTGYTNYYATDHWGTEHRLYRINSGVGTAMSSLTATAGSSRTLTVRALDSTIRGTDTSGWRHTVTDTSITTGLRVGIWAYIQQTSSGQRTASAFSARDFLTPTITSIAPTSGPSAGGTSVVITGTNFETNMSATIGGAGTTGVSVTPPTTLNATAPAGSAGARNVVVTNTDSGFTATLTSGFTYVDPIAPVVTDNSATALVGVGGTVQMSAANAPTSWSLLGSPPDGVSIDSSGLVTWTTATPVGVHSITTRAVNGAGANTGTLTLTITSPTPVVTNNAAGNTYGTGGTVQMVATNTPTSWSLQGSPPTGVSVNSSGLVTWTGLTPVGVHSITTRATNGSGSGDGTLTLTITMPAPVVTGGSLTRVYGVGGTVQLSATNTPTSWTLNSPPAGVSISGSGLVTVAANAAVQTATITVSAGNAGGSGTATLSLTITRAPLVVAANNKTRLTGAANPVFDGTITGYVLSETASVLTGAASFTATATTESPAGAYVITAAVGTLAAANYAFTFVNGVLTVESPVQPVTTVATQLTATVGTPANTLTRTATVRAAGIAPELRAIYDTLLGPDSDAVGIEARAAAFGRLLADPRYAALAGAAQPPAPPRNPGVYLSNVPTTAVVSVDVPAAALVATDGRAEFRSSIDVTAVGRYQIPNMPTAYVIVHALLAPFTVTVTVRRAATVTGGIGPGGDSTPARLAALLTPATRAALFGERPPGVYAEAAALAESSRFDERLAGVLIALVRRIAALS